MPPSPFRIAIPDADIADLQRRLAATRWPDEVNDADWSYGTDRAFLQSLVDRWQALDWRAIEARLNLLPQFVIDIDGLPIHFIHLRGTGPSPMPLLLTHGWPGSFVEMEAILPLLANPGGHGGDPADAFDVIVPSLPGYAFSGRPATKGCGPKAIAGIWRKLMAALGHDRYAIQGGDWGSIVSTWLARLHPEHVIGAHLNFVAFGVEPAADAPLTAEETGYLAALGRWRDSEGAYGQIQGTKPQTLGYALTDSPAGLAAWIAEKFRTWSDCGGDIARAIPLDAMLANIAIYWFTGNITSSLRIYKESRAVPLRFAAGERALPPLGVAHFPKEIFTPPRGYAERVFDVRQWTTMPQGGHFAAMEQPKLLAEDIRKFFRPLR